MDCRRRLLCLAAAFSIRPAWYFFFAWCQPVQIHQETRTKKGGVIFFAHEARRGSSKCILKYRGYGNGPCLSLGGVAFAPSFRMYRATVESECNNSNTKQTTAPRECELFFRASDVQVGIMSGCGLPDSDSSMHGSWERTPCRSSRVTVNYIYFPMQVSVRCLSPHTYMLGGGGVCGLCVV